MKTNLKSPCKMLRTNAPKGSSKHKVDREGGVFGAGLIEGVSLIQKGEALGHGMWVDEVMLQQTADHANDAEKGIKSRWTHPMLSDDGMGKYLGRLTNARVENNKAVADMNFAATAHKSPDGNFAAYLMDIAEEDPEALGLSIVFENDLKATREFMAEHLDEEGEFSSPDENNKHNFPHARIGKLRACDFVDEPAANEDGLFSSALKAGEELDNIGQFALGLSEKMPQVSCFDINPERIRKFATKFLDMHNLEIVKKEKSNDMPESENEELSNSNESSVADESQTEENAAEQLSEDTAETPEETEENAAEQLSEDTAGTPEEQEENQETPEVDLSSENKNADLKKFTDAFGIEQGAKYLLSGKSFSEAQADFCKKLQSENEDLKEQLKKSKNLSSLGGDEIEFSTPPEQGKKSIVRIKGQGE